MHSVGPSLSPPFPEPDRANRLVGRATIAFDCMENAMAMFKQLHIMRQVGELNKLRRFGANPPFGLNPTFLYLLTKARAAVGDNVLQALLLDAMREPKPQSAPPRSTTHLNIFPTPTSSSSSSSSSSTRSKSPSPARTRALPPPPPPAVHMPSPPPSSSPSPSPIHPHRPSPALSLAGHAIRRPPQPSPIQLYSDPGRPFIPRHYVVCLENLSPHAPNSFFDSLATSFPGGSPPFHTLVSRECFNTTLAFERVATRSVDYSFHGAEDADAFVRHVRGMDKRGEMDDWKAVRGCKVSVYQKIAEGGEVVGW